MKSAILCVAVLISLSGCRIPPSAPTVRDIQDSEKGSAAYLKTLTEAQRKSYDDLNADWLKYLAGDHTTSNRYDSYTILNAQMTLGRLGFGTLFTGKIDKRTQDALSLYQKNRGIFQSGNIDPLTSFALTEDNVLLDKRIVSTGIFIFYARTWNRYFAADGAWDYQNKDDSNVQTSHIDCDAKSRICTDAYAALGFGSALIVSTKTYNVTKWDDYRILAEFNDPPCEKDQLEIVRDAQTVALHMISTDRTNPYCKDLMGEPKAVDAHLVDGKEISWPRMKEHSKKQATLFQYSESAKRVIEQMKK